MGQPSEAERVRSYILAQAHKLSLPDLVAKVRADTAPLRDIANAVPPNRFFERPAAEDWSAAEVLTHILDMNEVGATSIEGILDHGAIPGVVSDLMTGGTRDGLTTAADYWKAYQGTREALLTRVLRASGDERLDVKITHAMFGALNWREWLLFMRVHDLDHMHQLQAISNHFAS